MILYFNSIHKISPKIWLALAAILITFVTLAWSMERGRLQYEVDYEDIITHIDGLKRWKTLSEKGLWQFLSEYLEGPPHAPLHSLMAAVSFAVAGPRDWAPYALSGILVFFFLLLVWKQTQHFGLLPAIFAVAMSAFVPVVYQSVHHFVPDFVRSLLTLWAMIVFPRWGDPAFSKRAALSGALFGLALLAKPSFFPYTLAMGFPAWALAVVQGIRAKGTVRALIPSLIKTWPFFVSCALVAAPHYFVAWQKIYHYIFSNQFGDSAYIWRSTSGLTHQIAYYWTGFSGKILLGEAVWVLLGTASLGVLIAFLKRKSDPKQSAAFFRLFVFTAWAWIFLAWNPLLNPFFGLVFQYGIALLASITLAWMIRIATQFRSLGRVLGLMVPTSLLFILVALLFPLKEYKWEITNHPDPEVRKFAQSIPSVVFKSFEKWRPISDSGYSLFSSYGEISSHRMNWLSLKARQDFQFFGLPHGSVDSQIKLLIPDICPHRVDFVFVSDKSSFGVYNDLPNAHTSEQLLEWIKKSPDYHLIEQFPTPNGGAYHLFMACPNFSIFERIDGLSHKTSPLRIKGTPVVMNALKNKITFIYNSPATGEGFLDLAMRCYPNPYDLDIQINGKNLGRIPVEPSSEFPESSLKIPLENGKNELVFTVQEKSGQPVAEPAFQLRRVRITPPGDESPMQDILRKGMR